MEILIPITLFVMIGAMVIAPAYFRSKERQKVAEAIRIAAERGQPLTPDVVELIATPEARPGPKTSAARDLRTGIIWLGVGVGLAACGTAIGFSEPDAFYPFLGFAAFPTFIGLAFIVLGYINRDKA